MLDGWWKTNPTMVKKLPMELDVPTYLCQVGPSSPALPLKTAMFYYLLCVGEYTCKSICNNTKQTVQFQLQDVTFFHKWNGTLQQIPLDSLVHLALSAHLTTLKSKNQKNDWKGVCIQQEHNGEPAAYPVQALGHRYLYV